MITAVCLYTPLCLFVEKKRFWLEYDFKKKGRFRGSKALIPLDNGISVVESCDDIVIRFNGDPHRGVLRSGGGHFGYKSAKCWTLENVSFLSPPLPPPTSNGGRGGIN